MAGMRSSGEGPNLELRAARRRAFSAARAQRDRAQLVEQMRRCARRAAEVGEVEALVLAVGVAGRILQPEQQRRHTGELVDERTDERDAAAAADRHRLAPI